MKKFVIYLDIDGVLVSYLKLKDRDIDGKTSFIPEAVTTLNAITSLFDADLCIVSTWGRGYYLNMKDHNEFKNFLLGRGIYMNNLTFGDPDDRAGFIIKRKLEGYTKYLVIDDESYEYYNRMPEIDYNRIISTNSWRGLDNYDLIYVSRNYKRLI